jgi:hypothetical protein
MKILEELVEKLIDSDTFMLLLLFGIAYFMAFVILGGLQ